VYYFCICSLAAPRTSVLFSRGSSASSVTVDAASSTHCQYKDIGSGRERRRVGGWRGRCLPVTPLFYVTTRNAICTTDFFPSNFDFFRHPKFQCINHILPKLGTQSEHLQSEYNLLDVALCSLTSWPTFQRRSLPPSSGAIIVDLKEAVRVSETSVSFYQTRSNIPEDRHLHTCRRGNLKSHGI
jgi:hypothetical protein